MIDAAIANKKIALRSHKILQLCAFLPVSGIPLPEPIKLVQQRPDAKTRFEFGAFIIPRPCCGDFHSFT